MRVLLLKSTHNILGGYAQTCSGLLHVAAQSGKALLQVETGRVMVATDILVLPPNREHTVMIAFTALHRADVATAKVNDAA